MLRRLRELCLAAAIVSAAIGSLHAQGYQYTTLQYPGANDTAINGINNAGVVAGIFSSNLTVVDTLQPGAHGFLYDGITWTEVNYPGALSTEIAAINNSGWYAGNYTFNSGGATYTHGFVHDESGFHDIVTPFANDAVIADISDDGTIVGTYSDDFSLGFDLATVGFVGTRNPNGSYTFASAPYLQPVEIGDRTLLSGVNNNGMKVGTFSDVSSSSVGFLLPSGAVANYPSAASTSLKDINNNNLIVGTARMNGSGGSFFNVSYLVTASNLIAGGNNVMYADLNIPGSGTYTVDPFGGPELTGHRSAQGINDAGVVVGFFDNDDGVFKGFIGVPQPGSPGDFDTDGDVDGADLLAWQRTLGATVAPGTLADGSNNGTIDAADLAIWKSHFGQTTGPASPLPEPSGLMIAISSIGHMVLSAARRCGKGEAAG